MEEGTVTCFVLVIQGCCHFLASLRRSCIRTTGSPWAHYFVLSITLLIFKQARTAATGNLALYYCKLSTV